MGHHTVGGPFSRGVTVDPKIPLPQGMVDYLEDRYASR